EEAEGGEDRDGGVERRQRLDREVAEVGEPELAADACRLARRGGLLQKRRREIDSRHVVAAPRERDDVPTVAAAEIDHARAGRERQGGRDPRRLGLARREVLVRIEDGIIGAEIAFPPGPAAL